MEYPLGSATLNSVEDAIASFKKPLGREEIKYRIWRKSSHLRALRYIRDCRLEHKEPCPIKALNIAKEREK